MEPLSDHLASSTQRNITVTLRLLVHLEEKIKCNNCSYLSHKKRVTCLQNTTKSGYNRTHGFAKNLLGQLFDDLGG